MNIGPNDQTGDDHAPSDEVRHHGRRRLFVQGTRSGHLHEAPVIHDRHAVGQRHRLGLIMGDVQHGGARLVVKIDELLLHGGPQVHIQVCQRLIEKHQRRLHDQATRERHPLALTAAEVRRPS